MDECTSLIRLIFIVSGSGDTWEVWTTCSSKCSQAREVINAQGNSLISLFNSSNVVLWKMEWFASADEFLEANLRKRWVASRSSTVFRLWLARPVDGRALQLGRCGEFAVGRRNECQNIRGRYRQATYQQFEAKEQQWRELFMLSLGLWSVQPQFHDHGRFSFQGIDRRSTIHP